MKTEERLRAHLKAAGQLVEMNPTGASATRRRAAVRRAAMATSAAVVVAFVAVGAVALLADSEQPLVGDDPTAADVSTTGGSLETSLPGNGDSPTDTDIDRSSGDLDERPRDADASSWPPTDPGQAATCAFQYPDDIARMAVAFDGTIVGIRRGDYVEEAAAAPVDLELRVNRAFRGDLGDTVIMHTWDFSDPDAVDAWDPTGIRVLTAAEESLDVMFCGFTRPFSASDAELWDEAFSESP